MFKQESTREEVDKLKIAWVKDPCFSLANLVDPKFLPYADELAKFEDSWHKRWEEQRRSKLQEISEMLGCPGNHKLAEYIQYLERRIDELRDRLREIEP